jgi:hypothetical protein
MTDSETEKTVQALRAFHGSRDAALAQLKRDEIARGMRLLAAIGPAAEPLTDEQLGMLVLDNEDDYYGSGAVDVLVAEVKRLRLLARPA